MTLSANPIKLTSEGSQSLIITNLREYDSRKHSVIFLDREWFKKGDLFSFGNFKLLIRLLKDI